MASTDEVAASSASVKIRRLHQNVRKIRISEKMGVKYMQKWEELVYAREDGKAAGRAEGEKLLLIRQVCKKLAKGKSPDVIAEEPESDPESVMEICQAAREAGPDCDCGQLYERLFGEPTYEDF